MEADWSQDWGLVSGRTQTISSWETSKQPAEPQVWYHDIFRPDGTPYDPGEVKIIRHFTTK